MVIIVINKQKNGFRSMDGRRYIAKFENDDVTMKNGGSCRHVCMMNHDKKKVQLDRCGGCSSVTIYEQKHSEVACSKSIEVDQSIH